MNQNPSCISLMHKKAGLLPAAVLGFQYELPRCLAMRNDRDSLCLCRNTLVCLCGKQGPDYWSEPPPSPGCHRCNRLSPHQVSCSVGTVVLLRLLVPPLTFLSTLRNVIVSFKVKP